jgi:hypothetical protein
LDWGLLFEVLGGGKRKGNVETSEFGFRDRRPELLTCCH